MRSAALVIGIDNYTSNSVPDLNGCVADSDAVAELFLHNDPISPNDKSRPPNLGQVVLCNSREGATTRSAINEKINDLLNADLDLAVIYFSGHGARDSDTNLGVLVTSDYSSDNTGIRMNDIIERLTPQRLMPGKSLVIILDCCHAASISQVRVAFGGLATTVLPLGLTILAASRGDESARMDPNGNGSRFTNLLIDGLKGGCADVTGHVTPPALYAHIDNSLQALEQRPIFATNIQRSVILRRCRPKIPASTLRDVLLAFPHKDHKHQLDPEYEDDRGELFDKKIEPYGMRLRDIPVDADKSKLFRNLQAMTRCGLVRPSSPEDHMFWAAVHSGTCELTELGKHYWCLAKKNLLRD